MKRKTKTWQAQVPLLMSNGHIIMKIEFASNAIVLPSEHISCDRKQLLEVVFFLDKFVSYPIGIPICKRLDSN